MARSLALACPASGDEPGGDDNGAVYVEFLLAFLPVFLLFLAICQLALMSSAALVVRHAAYVAARSAIVVLEDDPARYDDAPRGRVSVKRAAPGAGTAVLLAALGIAEGELPVAALPPPAADDADADVPPQRGARMVPIRNAAYLRLLTLAPGASGPGERRDTLLASVSNDFLGNLVAALRYTETASVITLHRNGAEHLATEPIPRDVPITARVTYLYTCQVPLVRAVMCRSLASLLPPEATTGDDAGDAGTTLVERMKLAEHPAELEHAVGAGARLTVLSAEVTLPNQGAGYVEGATP